MERPEGALTDEEVAANVKAGIPHKMRGGWYFPLTPEERADYDRRLADHARMKAEENARPKPPAIEEQIATLQAKIAALEARQSQ